MEATIASEGNGQKQILAVWLLSIVPFIVWLAGAGNIGEYLVLQAPPEQLMYVFSKLFGLYAYYFMTLQVIIGLQGKHSCYFKYHRIVATLTASSVIMHLALFTAAASIRTGHLAVANLMPTFNQGFYKSSVSYGALAAYGLLGVIAAGIWQKKWKLLNVLHKLAFVVIILGWLHSFNIGTETRDPATMGFYIGLILLALIFFIKKIVLNRGEKAKSTS